MKRKTVTKIQIDWLRWARNQAKDWRGNHNPEEYELFDSWIECINEAINAVKNDRKILRKLLKEKGELK